MASSAPYIDPKPIITLEPNITVRPYRMSDAESASHHANNRRIWLKLGDRLPSPYTVSDAIAWIKIATGQDETMPDWGLAPGPFEAPTSPDKVPGNYAICINDECVGSIGLLLKSYQARRTAELGWLGEEHWGKGIMTKVAKAFVLWTFETFGQLVRLSAHTYSSNPASASVLKKAGFSYEGTHRCAVWKDGQILDSWHFGVVREGL